MTIVSLVYYFSTKMPEPRKYILLDSAGIRKNAQRTMGAESFAVFRTVQAAWDSDVICIVVDGSEPVSHQDQIIAGMAKDYKKGIIIIANKADLVDTEDKKDFERSFYRKFDFLKIHDFIWVSALNNVNLERVWTTIDEVIDTQEELIDQEQVHKLFNYLMKNKQPTKLRTQRRAVIYDLVYTAKNPHTFDLLIKNKKSISDNYIKFLENIIRKQFNLQSSGFKLKITEVSKKNVLA